MNKVIIALLSAILAGVGYLIWREHSRDPALPPGDSRVVSAEPSDLTSDSPPLNSRPQYAPLRDRTNTFTSITSRRTSPTNVVGATALESTPPDATEKPVGTVLSGTDLSAPELRSSGLAGTDPASGISGRVLLRGTPPPEKPVALDPACGRLHPTPMTTRHYVVSADGGLANVFVYIKDQLQRDTQQDSIPVLDNINCVFEPYVFGVRAGQPFMIRNSDPLLHNAHLTPKINREFNIGMPVKGQTATRVLEHPEVLVRMKCDVHPWMFAYLGVVPHPWFAVTDTNGNFALPPGLPRGRYTLAAVHVKAGELTQELIVSGAPPNPAPFTFEVPEAVASVP